MQHRVAAPKYYVSCVQFVFAAFLWPPLLSLMIKHFDIANFILFLYCMVFLLIFAYVS